MDALLFDMDGVVVDSERHWAEREAETIFPTTVDGRVDPHDVAGTNVADLYDHLDTEYGTTVTKTEFLATYDDHAEVVYGDRARLLPTFDATVSVARDRDAAVGLVSSSPVRWIDLVLERFDLRETFDAVVSADHVERGKPSPAVYELAERRLDVDPSACVAVEDSTAGVTAARRAGMWTVGLLSPAGDGTGLADADRLTDAVGLADVVSRSASPRR